MLNDRWYRNHPADRVLGPGPGQGRDALGVHPRRAEAVGQRSRPAHLHAEQGDVRKQCAGRLDRLRDLPVRPDPGRRAPLPPALPGPLRLHRAAGRSVAHPAGLGMAIQQVVRPQAEVARYRSPTDPYCCNQVALRVYFFKSPMFSLTKKIIAV